MTEDLKVKRSFFILCSQYFTLNLYLSKVIYAALETWVLFYLEVQIEDLSLGSNRLIKNDLRQD